MREIREALSGAVSFSGAARALGVPRRTLDRLRVDFPEVFEIEKST